MAVDVAEEGAIGTVPDCGGLEGLDGDLKVEFVDAAGAGAEVLATRAGGGGDAVARCRLVLGNMEMAEDSGEKDPEGVWSELVMMT